MSTRLLSQCSLRASRIEIRERRETALQCDGKSCGISVGVPSRNGNFLSKSFSPWFSGKAAVVLLRVEAVLRTDGAGKFETLTSGTANEGILNDASQLSEIGITAAGCEYHQAACGARKSCCGSVFEPGSDQAGVRMTPANSRPVKRTPR